MSKDQPTRDEAGSRLVRRFHLFPLGNSDLRDERGLVHSLHVPVLLASLLLVGLALVLTESLAPAPRTSAASVTPEQVGRNPKCPVGMTELKIESFGDGVYTDGTLSVTITGTGNLNGNDAAGDNFDWSSNIGVDVVIVKAGDSAHVYTYNPESTGDSDLVTPPDGPPDNLNQGISHVSFCYDVEPPGPDPTLVVTKVCIDGDGESFGFNLNPDGDIADPTLDCDTSSSTITLQAGQPYSLTEDMPLIDGWTLSLKDCEGINPGQITDGVSFTPDFGDEIECTFTNTFDPGEDPTLVVTKVCIDGDGESFGFNLNPNGDIADPTLNCDASSGTITLQAGQPYSLTEDMPLAGGWTLTLKDCEGITPGQITDGVSFTPDYDDVIECTFTNTFDPGDNPTLVVTKVCINGDGQSFGFNLDPDGSIADPTVACDTSSSTIVLQAGQLYSLTETMPLADGWTLTLKDCTGISASQITDGISFTPDFDDGIECTFTNTFDPGDDPTLVVRKVCVDGTGPTFDFSLIPDGSIADPSLTCDTSSSTIVLEADTPYNLTEIMPLPDGWSLSLTGCTGINPGQLANGYSFTPEMDDEIVCTFTNTFVQPTGTITVDKVCDPQTADVFDLFVDDQEQAGDEPCGGTTGQVVVNVGPHSVSEGPSAVTDGYNASIECVDEAGAVVASGSGTSLASIQVDADEDIVCTITNVYIPVTPTISSQVTAELINLGGSPTSVQDAVSVTDGGGNGVPGEVDFYLCFNAGAYPLCAIGGVLVQENVGLDGNGDATSSAVTPTLPGYYCFRIEFEPDDTDLFNPLTHLDPAAETECFQVTAPDVDVEKSDDPDPVVAGGTLTYTIVTTNNGTGPTNATITVVDNLPDGLTNVSVTENGWNCDDEAIGEPTSGAVLTCTYAGVVNAGANAPDIVISATVPVDDCDNLSNVVGVSGPDAQDDTDENTDTEPTDVDGCVSDLDITKSGDATALFGDTIEYLIEVFNDGNNIAEDVVVTDNLPDSLEGVTAFWDTDDDPSDSTACAVNAGNVVVCNVGDIGVGETRWVLITATIDDCADVVNQATVSWTDPGDDPGTDDDTEQSNDSNVVTTAVTCSSVTIAKDTDPETDGVEFDFTGSFGGFTLEDGETVVFDELEPGVFSVTESDLPDGWNLTAIDCTNDDAGLAVDVDVDLGDETVLITLRPGEDVTCLFNNVFTPPVVVTEDETPTATPTPTTTPLVAEQAGVIVTPTPTSTLVAEVEQVRRLPTTGSGGPVEDELGFPWILAVALTTLAGGSLWVAFGRRGARTR